MRSQPCRWIGWTALVLMTEIAHAGGLQFSLDAVVSTIRGGIANPRFKVYMDEGFGATGEVLYQTGIVAAGVTGGFFNINGNDRGTINSEKLTFMPVQALLRVQPRIDSRNIGIHFELAAGVTFLRSELSRLDDPERLTHSEGALSVGGGVGFSQRIADQWAAKLSFRIQNIWPSEEIDSDGKIQMLLLTLGVRHQLH